MGGGTGGGVRETGGRYVTQYSSNPSIWLTGQAWAGLEERHSLDGARGAK